MNDALDDVVQKLIVLARICQRCPDRLEGERLVERGARNGSVDGVGGQVDVDGLAATHALGQDSIDL